MKRLAILALVAILSLVGITPAFAEGEYMSVNVNMNVPINGGKTVLGTFVVTDLDQAGVQNWTFNGQVSGKQASASGVATVTYTGTGYQGKITRIDSWNVAGVDKPALPIPLSVSQGSGKTATLSATANIGGNSTTISVPAAYSGVDQIPVPGSGNSAFSLTNVAGAAVTSLPRTGDLPGALTSLPAALVALGALALFGSRRVLRRVPA